MCNLLGYTPSQYQFIVSLTNNISWFYCSLPSAMQFELICYASCYVKLFDKAKARHQNRLDSVARSVQKLCDKAKNKVSGCSAVGSALPWGGRDRKEKSCLWQATRFINALRPKRGFITNPRFSFISSQNLLKTRVFAINKTGLFFPAFGVEQAHFSHLTT